ncbi:multicopper oxidase domain-containing protein [Aquibacillus salsiterrae]|uniref:Multicopper oxidase domain-containing protein n=1 Tax=Aquibacillus salsiterrae TaxID=2950439 RepID=A0A9X4AFA1_9BACI|nr:multicopper oxidase domain-containing protein [Aquibacillus salsiterrae]MDC3415838.1 multicopper oxidase domain-containing protein [Aquibacillus salsiterrae]
MTVWEERMSIPDLAIAKYQQGQNFRYFKLTVDKIKQPILSDITIDAYGFNQSTPGPLLVIKHGEWLFLEVENNLDEPTAVHVHGIPKPNSQDGAPDIEPTPKINPGESYTYKFQALRTGTFFYHSTMGFQANLGLLGPLVVLPQDGYIDPTSIPSHDYVQIIQQWQIDQPDTGKVYPGTYKPDKFCNNPNFFTLNGKSFPYTTPMYTSYGEKVRIRFLNKTNGNHTMHIHGHNFQIAEIDGFPRDRLYDDTIIIGSGKRYDIEFIANNPGVWPVNGTRMFHKSNNGVTPGGMVTRLKYR